MKNILTSLLLTLLLSFNTKAAIAEISTSELPECIVITHCIRENWNVSNVDDTFQLALKEIELTPRTKIVEQTDSYLHAEAKTKWRRYTDDLLVKAFPEKKMIQVRSESRVGIGDKGVNKKRVDELAYRLKIK